MFPIGLYTPPEILNIETVKSLAEDLVKFPEELISVTLSFSQNHLLTFITTNNCVDVTGFLHPWDIYNYILGVPC